MNDQSDKKNNSKKLAIEIITLFPGYFDSPLGESIVKRAKDDRLFDVRCVNLRDYGVGKHRVVDDTPFGGGGGMVLALEPLVNCLGDLGFEPGRTQTDRKLVLTSAAGRRFTQADAVELSLASRVTIICGHYLGVDERLLGLFDIEELSIGDYVLTGGEPAAAVMLDAIVRLIPGALGDFSSALADSHQEKILGAPVYTRPESFNGHLVPAELLSGDHQKVAEYRRRSGLARTARNRPDIIDHPEVLSELTDDEKTLVGQTIPGKTPIAANDPVVAKGNPAKAIAKN
ncbi:MAG: tRNA (guanosine(37)-N1)-methyltransferase TrmD [Candidatus Zixiibacteriota bacterium]